MKWRYYVDEYGDRWVDESDHYVIRVNGIGRFYIEDSPDDSVDGFDTFTEAKLYCEQQPIPSMPFSVPTTDEVWGDPDDSATWRKVADVKNDNVIWIGFDSSGVDTIEEWNEWVSKKPFCRVYDGE